MAKFPDLTGDGKVTQADILKGRGVYKKGGMAMKHDHGHKPMAKMSHGGHYCWGGKTMKKAEGGDVKDFKDSKKLGIYGAGDPNKSFGQEWAEKTITGRAASAIGRGIKKAADYISGDDDDTQYKKKGGGKVMKKADGGSVAKSAAPMTQSQMQSAPRQIGKPPAGLAALRPGMQQMTAQRQMQSAPQQVRTTIGAKPDFVDKPLPGVRGGALPDKLPFRKANLLQPKNPSPIGSGFGLFGMSGGAPSGPMTQAQARAAANAVNAGREYGYAAPFKNPDGSYSMAYKSGGRVSKVAKSYQDMKAGAGSVKTHGFKKGGSANWIQGAIKKPGALKKSLGVAKGEKIPAAKLEKASKATGKMGQRARLAMTLKGMK